MNNDSQLPEGMNQTSSGDQSPNIIAKNGDVILTYNNSGVTQEQFDQLIEELNVSRAAAVRLLKNLDEKDVALEDREAQFKDLLKKHNELEQRLANRDDDVSKQARELLAEGKLDEAEALLKESLANRLKNLKNLEEQRELAAAEAFELGGIHELKLDYMETRAYYRQAVELAPKNTAYLNALGIIEVELVNYMEAIDFLEQALAIDREVYGEKHPEVAIRLNNLGTAWNAQGKHSKALGLYYQALAIDRKVYGENHPNVARDLNNVGAAWNALDEYTKAIDLYEQALEILRKVYGEKHSDVAISLNNLGSAYDALGKHEKAIGLFEQALAIDREVYGDKHPEVATSLNNLGLVYDAQGKHEKAIGLFEQALAIDRKVYGEKHPRTAGDLSNQGLAWDVQGKHEKAIDLYEQALEILRNVYGEKHSDVAINLNNLGSAYDAQGKHEKAIGLYEQAQAMEYELALANLTEELAPDYQHDDTAAMILLQERYSKQDAPNNKNNDKPRWFQWIHKLFS